MTDTRLALGLAALLFVTLFTAVTIIGAVMELAAQLRYRRDVGIAALTIAFIVGLGATIAFEVALWISFTSYLIRVR